MPDNAVKTYGYIFYCFVDDIGKKIIFLSQTFFRYLLCLRWVSKYSPTVLVTNQDGFFMATG